MLSSMSLWSSSSVGKSLKAETWTRVGSVARASCMSRIFRYFSLVIEPLLKLAKEQFSSALVLRLLIVPGFFDSASMILNSFRPKISFRTFSECSVPDIKTRILFWSISSWSFCARLIETMFTMIGSSFVLELLLKSPFWVW